MRQTANGAAAELDGVTGAAGRADGADDGQRHVLGGHALAELAVDGDQHGLRFLLQQALRGQHMLDFRGADAVRQTGEGAVRRGMRIAANDGHARQRRAVFRADDVHDALLRILEREIGQRADFADVGVQRFDLLARNRILDALVPMVGRRIVVGRGDDGRDPPWLAAGQLQAFEGLRAGHFVHQMTVDVEERRAISFLMDDMVLPEFVVKCLRHGTLRIGRKALNYRTGSAVFASTGALTATSPRTQRQTSQKPPTAKSEANV